MRNLPDCFTEKNYFRDSNNSLTGEVKEKLMRFPLDKK